MSQILSYLMQRILNEDKKIFESTVKISISDLLSHIKEIKETETETSSYIAKLDFYFKDIWNHM